MRVLHKSAFGKGFGRSFDVDTIASHTTRLECAYVDIDEDSNIWLLGRVIDKPNLESLIENIDEVLKNI